MSEITSFYDASGLSAIGRFWALAAYFPRCSYAKIAAFTRPREIAHRYPYVQLQTKAYRAWLVFDMDDLPDWFSWDDCDLPPPNIVVRSPIDGRRSEHWFYAVCPVAWGRNARLGPMKLMGCVYKAMTRQLRHAGAWAMGYPGNPQPRVQP